MHRNSYIVSHNKRPYSNTASLTAVKCCKQSPSISVINKLRRSQCIDSTCGVMRNSTVTLTLLFNSNVLDEHYSVTSALWPGLSVCRL